MAGAEFHSRFLKSQDVNILHHCTELVHFAWSGGLERKGHVPSTMGGWGRDHTPQSASFP